MSSSCLNCGQAIHDKYCSHCGQKASVARLTWHSIGEEFFHFFTHIDKGFAFTMRELAFRPGRLSKSFLDGRRKQYHKPVAFLLIWITVYLLVTNGMNAITHYKAETGSTGFSPFGEHGYLLNKYRSIIEMIIIPFLAFSAWVIVASGILNYVEVLTISFYFSSFLFMLLSIQVLIFAATGLNYRSGTADMISTLLYSSWMIFATWDFYKRYPIRQVLYRVILALLAGVLIYFLLARLILGLLASI